MAYASSIEESSASVRPTCVVFLVCLAPSTIPHNLFLVCPMLRQKELTKFWSKLTSFRNYYLSFGGGPSLGFQSEIISFGVMVS